MVVGDSVGLPTVLTLAAALIGGNLWFSRMIHTNFCRVYIVP